MIPPAEPTDADRDNVYERRADELNFGEILADEGITTVALDRAGRLIEHSPDGTQRVLHDDPSSAEASREISRLSRDRPVRRNGPLADQLVPFVELDGSGALVEYRPDGTTRRI